MLDLISLDAMTLGEEIMNMRKGGSQLSDAEKLIIHLRYLMTSRFDDSQELALKLIKTFVQTVGSVVKEAGDLLVSVS